MRWLALCMMFMSALYLAAKEHDCMIIHFKEGSYAIIPLNTQPKIYFSDGLITIDNESFQISGIKKYTIADSEGTGIDEILSDKGVNYNFMNDKIYVRTAKNNPTVRLYSMEGILVPVSYDKATEGMIVIGLSSLDKGIYLLTVGEQTIKIQKR